MVPINTAKGKQVTAQGQLKFSKSSADSHVPNATQYQAPCRVLGNQPQQTSLGLSPCTWGENVALHAARKTGM